MNTAAENRGAPLSIANCEKMSAYEGMPLSTISACSAGECWTNLDGAQADCISKRFEDGHCRSADEGRSSNHDDEAHHCEYNLILTGLSLHKDLSPSAQTMELQIENLKDTSHLMTRSRPASHISRRQWETTSPTSPTSPTEYLESCESSPLLHRFCRSKDLQQPGDDTVS